MMSDVDVWSRTILVHYYRPDIDVWSSSDTFTAVQQCLQRCSESRVWAHFSLLLLFLLQSGGQLADISLAQVQPDGLQQVLHPLTVLCRHVRGQGSFGGHGLAFGLLEDRRFGETGRRDWVFGRSGLGEGDGDGLGFLPPIFVSIEKLFLVLNAGEDTFILERFQFLSWIIPE